LFEVFEAALFGLDAKAENHEDLLSVRCGEVFYWRARPN